MARWEPVRCRIPELLIRIGKSRAWLSEKSGVSRQRISDYVNMRNRIIMSLPTAKMFSEILECEINELYEWVDNGIGGE